jgi:hypothetical protein
METKQLRFRDRRAPHEIRHFLERRLMTLLRIDTGAGRLAFRGTLKSGYGVFQFDLTLQAAHWWGNLYSLQIEASPLPGAKDDQAFRKSAQSWFGWWTSDFKATSDSIDNSPDRHRQCVEQALASESAESTVAGIQRTIAEAVRAGATFSTAHKEGGTNIGFRGGKFFRSDYGESSEHESFATDEAFLAFLRRFYHGEVSRNSHPHQVPELDAWKLILRLMDRK